ncbi:DNA polymerase epsilon subunit 2-like [Ornithodoros turicata]
MSCVVFFTVNFKCVTTLLPTAVYTMSSRLKSKIINRFHIGGFTLRGEASRYLQELLESQDEDRQKTLLNGIVSWVQGQTLNSALIDKQTLIRCIKQLSDTDDEQKEKLFEVIDAFSIPSLTYHSERKKFLPREFVGLPKPRLFGNADSKALLFQERYKLVHQRTIRHPLFSGADSLSREGTFTLRPVEHLLGTAGGDKKVVVLGMITQLTEGKYHLEDTSGSVEIDLSKASFTGGLFTENCFVLAEGQYDDGVFHVQTIGLPPAESGMSTQKYFGSINFFGGTRDRSARLSAELRHAEEMHQDAMLVFISDLWLDQHKVFEKLRVLFAGYSMMPPTCFVLCGNFLSRPTGRNDSLVLKECISKLASLIGEFPSLTEKSYFVFVPGPADPGLPNILPRPGLPRVIMDEFCRQVPQTVAASNPCRIRYGTQEIVVFREDALAKACRNAVHLPWEQESTVDLPKLYTKTLASNSHLVPLPLAVSPVYWDWDFALWLNPLPDVVVCADKHDSYAIHHSECLFFNPGSFPRSDFSFKVYLPASKTLEDSQISEEPS